VLKLEESCLKSVMRLVDISICHSFDHCEGTIDYNFTTF